MTDPAPASRSPLSRWLMIVAVLIVLAFVVAIAIPGLRSSTRAYDDVSVSRSLKTLATAEADFRQNDRDLNKVEDYWTGDVAGLYYLEPAGPGSAIRIIRQEIADADVRPLPQHHPKNQAFEFYRYQALDRDDGEKGEGGDYRRDTDKTGLKAHHPSKFGFCAFPEAGSGAQPHFLVNESNVVLQESRVQPRTTYPSREDAGKLQR